MQSPGAGGSGCRFPELSVHAAASSQTARVLLSQRPASRGLLLPDDGCEGEARLRPSAPDGASSQPPVGAVHEWPLCAKHSGKQVCKARAQGRGWLKNRLAHVPGRRLQLLAQRLHTGGHAQVGLLQGAAQAVPSHRPPRRLHSHQQGLWPRTDPGAARMRAQGPCRGGGSRLHFLLWSSCVLTGTSTFSTKWKSNRAVSKTPCSLPARLHNPRGRSTTLMQGAWPSQLQQLASALAAALSGRTNGRSFSCPV